MPAHEVAIAERFSVLSIEEQARLYELLRKFDSPGRCLSVWENEPVGFYGSDLRSETEGASCRRPHSSTIAS